jgi:DNA-binding NarL/FixJ family response regulator
MPIRVVVIDDHKAMAEGLALALRRQPDIEVVGSAGSVAEAVPMVREARPDVILLDFHLPDGTGADLLDQVRPQIPEVAAVLLTADPGEGALVAAISAGASGYLTKLASLEEIVTAVRRAAAGELAMPAASLNAYLRHQRSNAAVDNERSTILASLTSREREVLRYILQGMDNQAIANALTVSVATVRSHVQNILSKLDVHSKLEAMAKAAELGIN